MKIITVAIALIIIGLTMVCHTGFDFITTEKIADFGPIKQSNNTNHSIQWSPIIGAVLLLGGFITIIRAKKVT